MTMNSANSLSRRLTTPVPMRMRTLPRDNRDYPVPFIVMRDRNGKPQFTINDHSRVIECVSKKLCAICGKRFTDGMWFVGGPRCFVHQYGAFLDPPAHVECAEYALRVCPYLAAPSYARRIDDRKLSPDAIPDGTTIVMEDIMPDDRPDVFALGHTDEFATVHQEPGQQLFIVRRWRHVEFWRHGALLNSGLDPRALAAWSA
jgi:hypothetical protein